MQLMHAERVSYPSMQSGGGLSVAPSAIKPEGQSWTASGPQDCVVPHASNVAADWIKI